MTYGLPSYGIVWILVRQRPLMGQEFQNDFSGLFGNTFRSGLASCESRFIIFCFIYLFIYLFIFFYFLFFFGFYTEQVFVERCFHIYFSFCESIMVSWEPRGRGRVHFWYSCMLMACNFTNNKIFCAFSGLLSVGECISSKNNG